MDIDSPDSSPEGLVSSFSAVFPLPFRVLALVGFGGLCWATNLHVLDWLGVDTALALQIPHHRPTNGLPSHTPPLSSPISSFPGSLHAHPSSLYPPVYRVAATYISFVTGGWLLFYMLSQGDVNALNASKWVPAICFTIILVAAVVPLRDVYGVQRSHIYQSLYRCLFSSSEQPVYFCDVIAADILTSFAKVLGDIFISVAILLPGGSLQTTYIGGKLSDVAVPVLLSVPYAIRLRQCVVEYMGSGGVSQRPMYNAVKYATAFPVIFLSAAQRLLNADNDDSGRTWYGEYAIFRLWLLAVFVNSSYSFWWDVTNDWGLTILRGETWSKESRTAYHALPQSSSSGLNPARSSSAGSSGSSQVASAFAKSHSRKQSSFSALPLSSLPSTPMPESKLSLASSNFNNASSAGAGAPQAHPFGLRAPLLYRDSTVYYLVILINFVLRFTWSLKLSSHLHTVADLESGVFLMEALELIRRWVWVFFRVEWENVKKMQEREVAHSLMKSVGPSHAHGLSSMNGNGHGENIELFRFPEEDEMDLHDNGGDPHS